MNFSHGFHSSRRTRPRVRRARPSSPLHATAQKWTYRAIYRDDEGRVGQWSALVSITVAA